MSLVYKTESQLSAEKISAEAASLAYYTQASLRSIYAHLTTADTQAVLNELGTEESPKAAAALKVYVQFHQALEAVSQLLGENFLSSVTAPDLTVFAPQADGRVVYTAPPMPEPVPMPEAPAPEETAPAAPEAAQA